MDMAATPAPRRARVFIEPYEVAVQLARIGIPASLLHQAGEDGHVDRVFASPLDFPGRGEYDAASTALRTICQEGGKLQTPWHRDIYLGIPVASNLDSSIAVAVTSGDEFTGIDGDQDPKIRPPKGLNSERAAAANARLRLLRPADEGDPGVELLHVLTYVDGEHLRMELSKSSVIVASGQVMEWSWRIILPGVDLDGVGRRPIPLEPSEPTEINPLRRQSS